MGANLNFILPRQLPSKHPTLRGALKSPMLSRSVSSQGGFRVFEGKKMAKVAGCAGLGQSRDREVGGGMREEGAGHQESDGLMRGERCRGTGQSPLVAEVNSRPPPTMESPS